MATSTPRVDSIPNSRRKVALVIGNSKYQENAPLPNASNDAKQMASSLKDIGFIIHGSRAQIDLTYIEMRHVIVDFVYFIERGDMILFYFAGHGTQWEDQNYLIPIDNFTEKDKVRKPLTGPELAARAINVQNLLNEINDQHPFVTMFFLDCCRTYHLRNSELQKNKRGEPINPSQGLKEIPLKVGSLIAFACAPGTTADDGNNGEQNGLFTKHLLRHIGTVNEDVRIMFSEVTHGVVKESNEEQIPHMTCILTHRNVCLYEQRKDVSSVPTMKRLSISTDKTTTTTTKPDQSKYHKWKQNATTVAGGNGQGQQLNQLSFPHGICVDQNKNIFIADYGNDRIVRWDWQMNKGTVVAGGNGKGNRMNQLDRPTDVIIDKQNHSMIIADCLNGRVIRWFEQSQSNQQILIDRINCWGLAMDKDGFLYVSDVGNHAVRRWKEGERQGTIVAGGNGKGNELNQLNCPFYLFVDEEQSVYVSDCQNHRVMKWLQGAKEGRIVAGGNGQGDRLHQLFHPQGVFVDHWGQIYVADRGNNRVMRWREGEREGEIIVGGNGQGQESNQLSSPFGLSFDDEGNLYVADWWNDRIQKFDLILSWKCFFQSKINKLF